LISVEGLTSALAYRGIKEASGSIEATFGNIRLLPAVGCNIVHQTVVNTPKMQIQACFLGSKVKTYSSINQ